MTEQQSLDNLRYERSGIHLARMKQQSSFSDEELDGIIQQNNFLMGYLNETKECNALLYKLRLETQQFEIMLENRRVM